MKRTLTDISGIALPSEISCLTDGARIYDSSCSAVARVFFIERDGGYYLKLSPVGTLKKEALLTDYFHQKKLSAEVLHYSSGEQDVLLTTAVKGEDCTHSENLASPNKLCDKLGTVLRALHEESTYGCPITDRMTVYKLDAVKGRNRDASEESLRSYGGIFPTVDDAWNYAQTNAHRLKNEVLIHGDFCLPNVILNKGRFSGFIDLGAAGVGDRHVDLYWGIWSLNFNLKTDKYTNRFLDAYGRDAFDKDMISVVSAFEVFR